MGMFETATKLKLRFPASVGKINAEDLWDLPLTVRGKGASLDNVARQLHRDLKAGEEESFVSSRNTKNKVLELKFEIVKHVIEVKLEEEEKAKNVLLVKAKKQKILEIIESKEDEALAGKGVEDLKKMLQEL